MNEQVNIYLPETRRERTVVSLNGIWEIYGADMSLPAEDLPAVFTNTIPVPGLWDMAEVKITENAAWYKKSFSVAGSIPSCAILKINKAFWGKYIYINGIHVCDHHPNFTPAYVDITNFIRLGSNTLLIKTGAFGTQDRKLGHIVGYDLEKLEYIPGIYDDVSLLFTNNPFIKYLQVAPQLENSSARVQLVVENKSAVPVETEVYLEIRESGSNVPVAAGQFHMLVPAQNAAEAEYTVKIPQAKLWSPEFPFLYEIIARTEGDSRSDRFGMRSFHFDGVTKLAMLNGKPYYLRGNNITMYRFFEDPLRNGLPWNREWAREVLAQFKALHMNSIRYCIGFPPELWYELADELGFLIDDEYPIWTELQRNASDGKYPFWGEHLPVVEETAIPELMDWLRERANHPCVVIWDIQNESGTYLTEVMIKKLRESGIDLSRRPWDNGWAPPASPLDSIECHPYVYGDVNFTSDDLNTATRDPAVSFSFCYNYSRSPDLRLLPENPRIINEYCWLWLDRNGLPTPLTKQRYEKYTAGMTTEERRNYHAKELSKLTEFWRSGRKAAGILYFCGLTYGKEGGFTCDAFLPDIAHPAFHPAFKSRMRDAMAPVGICIEDFRWRHNAGDKEIKVAVYNDLDTAWAGAVSLALYGEGKQLSCSKQEYRVPAYGKTEKVFAVTIPSAPKTGYSFIASYSNSSGEEVKSIRDFVIL